MFLGYFEPELTGVSVPHISGDQIAGFKFPYVPVDEQVSRAAACDAALAVTAGAKRKTQRSIERLLELRGALIGAAVTGQLDVGDWKKRSQTERKLDQIETRPRRKEARA
jgi:type I restriction enzyme S subunit